MREYREINRLNWNDRTAIHAKSKFYDVEAFLADGAPRIGLDQVELGDVAGPEFDSKSAILGT